MFEHLLHTNTVWDIFCPYLCYIRKCNMAEPMLHTKIWYLSVSALSFLHMKMCNHVNINVYAKFHHNSPLSSAIFTFSEFGARHSLDRS